MKNGFKTALLGCTLAASAMFGTAARADAVLFLHYGPASDNYSASGNQLAGFIDAAPNSTVTIGSMYDSAFSLADLNAYNQIWVYDLNNWVPNTGNVLSNSNNIASWYNARNTAGVGNNLILDGRILSSAWSPPTEPGLIQSFYNNFASSGGGLFLGTDHCFEWCTGINNINAAIGVGAFHDFYGASYAILDTASPLAQGVPCTATSGPTCFILSNTTTGFAPAGLQSNGQFLTPLAYNTTNPNDLSSIEQAYSLTAISSTFGSRTFGTETSVPEPATLALFGAGLMGMAAMRRRRKAS